MKLFRKSKVTGVHVGGIQHLLDGAADILGGVQQSAVDIEQIDRETRGSRRLRTLPFREARHAASAFGADHLLRMILGILAAVRRQRRQRSRR